LKCRIFLPLIRPLKKAHPSTVLRVNGNDWNPRAVSRPFVVIPQRARDQRRVEEPALSQVEVSNHLSPCSFLTGLRIGFFNTVLTLLILLALKPLCGAAEGPSPLKAGEEHLEAGRLAEADEIASRMIRENARSAAALELKGKIAFFQGQYDEAIRVLDQALAIESANDRRQAYRLLAQQTRDTVTKLKRFESPHFVLFADEARDGILVSHALEALEKTYQAIGKTLGYFPPTKVRVEIAPDVSSFNAISTLSRRDIEETGAVGICKFNKIMTISPRTLIQGYRWLDSLSHEYLHYAIIAMSGNKAPIWLHEGMARFYETRWRKPEPGKEREDYLTPANQNLLLQALNKNKFVGFKNMEPSLIHLDTPEEVQLAYAEAASAIDFMVKSKGQSGIQNLLSELNTLPTPGAIEKTLGISFATFESEWKSFLKEMGLKEVEGSRVRKLKVKGNQKEDEEAVELREIQSVVARNRTHLADQFAEKGRVVAAIQEYQRALQASPHSPVILNKMARLLIQRERYDEALPHLKKAHGLDPDNVTIYVQLGRLHHAKKNYPEAKAALEEAIQINPFNPTIHRLLYEIHAALGEKDQANKSKAILDRLMTTK